MSHNPVRDPDPQRYHRCQNSSCRALIPSLGAVTLTADEYEAMKLECAQVQRDGYRAAYQDALERLDASREYAGRLKHYLGLMVQLADNPPGAADLIALRWIKEAEALLRETPHSWRS